MSMYLLFDENAYFVPGIIDASIMPLLALLVDTRHVPAYGSVYVIAQVAICLAYATGNFSVRYDVGVN